MHQKLRQVALVLATILTLSSCSAGQVSQWFAERGLSISETQATQIADHYTNPPKDTVEGLIRARWAGTGHEERAVRIARCESHFNPHAQNRSSTAYGIFQFLNSTWKGTGIAKTSDPRLQVEAAFRLWKARGWQPWVCRG